MNARIKKGVVSHNPMPNEPFGRLNNLYTKDIKGRVTNPAI